MKRNGFTLIELIATVTILAFITAITFPVILSSLNSGQEKVDDGVKKVVESAAESYVNDTNNFVDVTVCTLAQEGYISMSFFEKNKENIEQGLVEVKLNNSDTKYTYKFKYDGNKEECDLK